MITLKRATPEAVRYACLNFHYAKAVPVVQYAYNVYNINNQWCGCIVFSAGANYNIASAVGLRTGEVLELVRVALNGKQETTSECVAAAMRQVHKDAPQIKAVISYADIDQNHIGIIYQATNWIYIGDVDTGDTYFLIKGKKTHRRSIGAIGGKESIGWVKANLDPDAEVIKTKGKRKYLFVYDKKFRKQWQKKALPYPKKGE